MLPLVLDVVIDLLPAGAVGPGTWVLVHTGFVIQTLDEDEARETLEAWSEVLSHVENERKQAV